MCGAIVEDLCWARRHFSSQEWKLVAVDGGPKEMAQAVSEREIVSQYRRLQTFVRELVAKADCSSQLPLLGLGNVAPHRLNHFEGLEVYIDGKFIVVSTSSLSVHPKTGAETLQCAREAIAELKEGIVLKAKCLRGLRVHVRGMCSCVPKAKCLRGCGWGTVAGIRMQLSDTNLYSVLMTLPISTGARSQKLQNDVPKSRNHCRSSSRRGLQQQQP